MLIRKGQEWAVIVFKKLKDSYQGKISKKRRLHIELNVFLDKASQMVSHMITIRKLFIPRITQLNELLFHSTA